MSKIRQLTSFLTGGIWIVDDHLMRPITRCALWMLRRLIVTAEGFSRNNLGSLASALTYSCLLAAVPVLSVMFAIARGFGFGAVIEERVRANIHANEEMVESVFSFIDNYLQHTHNGVFVGVGLLLMLYTVTMLSSNIENAFNTIWHARRSRNVYRKVLGYAALCMLLPILIIVTSGFSVFMVTILDQLRDFDTISTTMGFVIQYTPVALSCLSFMALYKLMPNTHVRWRAVVVPGLLAGVLFQVLEYLYINYQMMLSGYNAVYGSFAALPMFMLWMQLSWYVCLLGAQMSYAVQHTCDYIFAKESGQLPRRDRDTLCLLTLAHIAKRFEQGQPPVTAAALADIMEMPHSLVQEMVNRLSALGLVCETADSRGTSDLIQPAMDLRLLTVGYVTTCIDSQGQGHISPVWLSQHPECERTTAARLSSPQLPVTALLNP